MNKGDKITDFWEVFQNGHSDNTSAVTMWAKVKSVDWGNKTMKATGVMDELDCEDVLLGLGHVYRKPVVGSLCLLGMIENRPAAWFMIDAEKVEETVIKDKKLEITLDGDSEKVKVENGQVSLTDLFDSLFDVINTLAVNTPVGPSAGLMPTSITKLNQFKTQFKQLLK